MNNLEHMVTIAIDCLDVSMSDEQVDKFELEFRRRLMKEFCSMKVAPMVPPYTTTLTGSTGTKELLRG